jgi:hypothetical protein
VTNKAAKKTKSSQMLYWIIGCIYVNATLLALVGLFLFSVVWATRNSTDWWLSSRDPLLDVSNWTMLVIAGLLHTAVAAYLFAARDLLNRGLGVLWMGLNYLLYYGGIHLAQPTAIPNTERFLGWRLNLQPTEVDFRWKLLMAYLIATGSMLLVLSWRHSTKVGKEVWLQQWKVSRARQLKGNSIASNTLQRTEDYTKMICPCCGQKITFPLSRAGERLPCPNCGGLLTLNETTTTNNTIL